MNISGIRPYEGFYSDNTIRPGEYQKQAVHPPVSGQNTDPDSREQKPQAQGARSSREEASRDHAEACLPQFHYEQKSGGQSLPDLDMERAISDSQKEQLLKQYQFFVGSSSLEIVSVQNPMLRSVENFDL